MSEKWFYQYRVQFYDEDKNGDIVPFVRDGLLVAENMIEAVEILEKMYGNLEDIQRLTPIIDGAFDFQENEEEDLLIGYKLIKVEK